KKRRCVMFNERVKKLTVTDIALIKFSVFFFAILVAQFLPFLLYIKPMVLVLLVVVSAARPLYVFWLKK
ncbi:MAG: hypothetical protein PHV55_07925, partial [Candidatus Omnitrophica bacterium]|nr:hypothetical protein [Candidatus Omnitrophota bacterium]